MAVCKKCGKKGWFLRLNELGICNECVQAEIEKKKNDAHLFYQKLVEMYADMTGTLQLPKDPCDIEDICNSIHSKKKCVNLFKAYFPLA